MVWVSGSWVLAQTKHPQREESSDCIIIYYSVFFTFFWFNALKPPHNNLHFLNTENAGKNDALSSNGDNVLLLAAAE